MPESDLALAETPAEQHLLAAPQRREVDQTLVEILDEQAQLLKCRGAATALCRLFVDRRLQLVDFVRPYTAPIADDLGRDPSVANRCDGKRPPVGDHLLDEETHRWEKLIRLVHREVAIGHGYMFSRSGPARRSRCAERSSPRDRPPRRSAGGHEQEARWLVHARRRGGPRFLRRQVRRRQATEERPLPVLHGR